MLKDVQNKILTTDEVVTKQVETKQEPQDELKTFSFPNENRVIKARDYQEALKLLSQ